MGNAARCYWKGRDGRPQPTQSGALAILDEICGPYKGRDAEFEADDPDRPGYVNPNYDEFTDPEGPIGKLIAIAFEAEPEELEIATDDGLECPWLDGPYSRFMERYRFC